MTHPGTTGQLPEATAQGFISYKKGYKYQLYRTIQVDTGIIPPAPVRCDYSSLTIEGVLTLLKGFATDGPSGPTLDIPSFMAGAFAHDAIYEMLRLGRLPTGHGYRKQADQLLKEFCIVNGMWTPVAGIVYAGVRVGSKPASKPTHQRKVLIAPAIGWREVTTEVLA